MRFFALVYFVLPVAYTWSLPLLASVGFAVPFSPAKFPRRSISAYMSNARATGAMAAVMMPSFIMMWVNVLNFYYTKAIVASLALFQVGFSVMLVFTVTWNLRVHKFGVLLMSIGAFLYCFSMIKSARQHIAQTALLIVAIVCFGFMVLVAALNLKQMAGLERYFYVAEVTGLAAIVANVPLVVWRPDYTIRG